MTREEAEQHKTLASYVRSLLPKGMIINQWYPFQLTDENGNNPKTFEAASIAGKVTLRVRKHIKDDLYMCFKFNKKGELIKLGRLNFTNDEECV